MAPWLWFMIVVVVGMAILGAALLLDRRSARLASGADEPAPRREHPAVDAVVPHYVTQDEVDAMPDPGRGAERHLSRRGEGFGFGHAHRDFATNPAGAAWDEPRVLVVDGTVTAMRELLAPLQRATPDAPLVVVAEGFHDDVLTTLAANRRAVDLPVVACAAGARDRRRLAELLGAERLTPADLQAGYLPESSLARASHWSSTSTQSWVTP